MTVASDPTVPQPTETSSDLIAPALAAALGAALDHTTLLTSGADLPPLWHWMYFWPLAAQATLGRDGHPPKGGFMPDLGLPRRMFAGGRLHFNAPIVIGTTLARQSHIAAVQQKEGRSGRLGFVTVRHAFSHAGVVLLEEEQDIVYRDPPLADAPAPPPIPAPAQASWQRRLVPSETLLFRYSALTFNSHRIHYDRPYAIEQEGYPDLVVQGTLLATLLLDLLQRHLPAATVRSYTFKAQRPAFVGHGLTLCGRLAEDGRQVDLWSRDDAGFLSMSAHAELA